MNTQKAQKKYKKMCQKQVHSRVKADSSAWCIGLSVWLKMYPSASLKTWNFCHIHGFYFIRFFNTNRFSMENLNFEIFFGEIQIELEVVI